MPRKFRKGCFRCFWPCQAHNSGQCSPPVRALHENHKWFKDVTWRNMCKHLSFWASGCPENNMIFGYQWKILTAWYFQHFALLMTTHTSNLIDECLQGRSPIFNEAFFVNAIVSTERHLPFQSFTRQWRHNDLWNINKGRCEMKWYMYQTLLSLSNSFFSHSKSEYLNRTKGSH